MSAPQELWPLLRLSLNFMTPVGVFAALAVAAVASTAAQVGGQVAAGQAAKKGARRAEEAAQRRQQFLAQQQTNILGRQQGLYQQAVAMQRPFDELQLERAQFGNEFLGDLRTEMAQSGGMSRMERRSLSDALRVARRNAAITGGPGGAFQVASGRAIADMADRSSQRRFDRLRALAFGQPVGSAGLGQQFMYAGTNLNALMNTAMGGEAQSIQDVGLFQQQGFNAQAGTYQAVGQTTGNMFENLGGIYGYSQMGPGPNNPFNPGPGGPIQA